MSCKQQLDQKSAEYNIHRHSVTPIICSLKFSFFFYFLNLIFSWRGTRQNVKFSIKKSSYYAHMILIVQNPPPILILPGYILLLPWQTDPFQINGLNHVPRSILFEHRLDLTHAFIFGSLNKSYCRMIFFSSFFLLLLLLLCRYSKIRIWYVASITTSSTPYLSRYNIIAPNRAST